MENEMSLNIWECQHPGCQNSAVGVGSAVGLRAIGWWFELGPKIKCPFHNPIGEERARLDALQIQELPHFTLESY
jgi:hypothetical protein